MRTNSMTKRAAGAMLFGGTLGLAQTASAAVVNAGGTVTFLNTGIYLQSYTVLDVTAPGGIGDSVYGSFAGGTLSGTATNLTAGLNWTAPVPAGVFSQSITMKASRSGSSTSNRVQGLFGRVFTVTGGSAVWTGSLSNNGATGTLSETFQIAILDQTTGALTSDVFLFSEYMTGNASQNFSGTLAEGTYFFYSQFNIGPTATNDATFVTFNIPAPGAVALLGAAGLIGSRRRRS